MNATSIKPASVKPPPMKSIAQLQGICKSYGSGHAAVTALRDVDLTFYPGQLTLIEGPSGCGKTTLLEVLGLLLPPTSGQVLIDDRRASGLGQAKTTRLRRRHVAFVFQDFNLLESLVAHDNIAIVAGLHGPESRRPHPRGAANPRSGKPRAPSTLGTERRRKTARRHWSGIGQQCQPSSGR